MDKVNSVGRPRLGAALSATTVLTLGLLAFAGSARAEGLLIGVLFPSQNQVRWAWEQKFFKEQAEANGDEAIFQFSQESVATQKTQVESFIQQGVDTLVMTAVDANAGNELVTAAQAEGIKVITYDRGVSTATPDYHISRNNYDAGRLQAEAALTFVPSGNYAIIRGDPSTIAQADMSRAYDELLMDKPGVNVVYDSLTPRWDTSLVQRNAEAALQAHPEIDAFVVQWDDAAQAVVQALKSAGKEPGEVFVSGLDSATPSLVYIAQGWQSQTIWTPIDQMAREAANLAQALGSGAEVPLSGATLNGVPVKYVGLTSITKDNLCSFITEIAPDGWVSEEEVFGEGSNACE